MFRRYLLLLVCFSLLIGVRPAAAGPIYVYKDSHGSIRFSSLPPPGGTEAKVFTARSSNFAYYRVLPPGRSFKGGSKVFPNLYNSIIHETAALYRVDSALIKAVIHAESGFNPRAVSPKGALGLMQLMPDNVRLFGVRNAFAPIDNIQGGTRLLSLLLRRFNGNLKLTLAAYNAGSEAVEKYGGIPPYAETQVYVRRVLSLWERYRRGTFG